MIHIFDPGRLVTRKANQIGFTEIAAIQIAFHEVIDHPNDFANECVLVAGVDYGIEGAFFCKMQAIKREGVMDIDVLCEFADDC